MPAAADHLIEMLLSHTHEFIFLKTNKTAGTSVEMALQPWCAPDTRSLVTEQTHAMVSANGIVGQRLVPTAERTDLDRTWYSHMPAAEIATLLEPAIWDSYVKLHTIRNPFDKVLSSFFWNTGRRGQSFDSFEDARAAFNRFVHVFDWATDEDIVHIDGNYVGDGCIRYERLADDLVAVAARLGLESSALILPTTKVTVDRRAGRSIEEFYDTQAIERVLDRAAWIFDRFGYTRTPGE